MTADARLILGAAGLVILAVAVVSLLVIAERRLRAIVSEQRRLHLQQATIVGMMLRAGFRGPSAARDWGDSALATKINQDSATRLR